MSWKDHIDLRRILNKTLIPTSWKQLKKSKKRRFRVVDERTFQATIAHTVQSIVAAETAKVELMARHRANNEIDALKEDLSRLRAELVLARATAEELARARMGERVAPTAPSLPPKVVLEKEELTLDVMFEIAPLQEPRPQSIKEVIEEASDEPILVESPAEEEPVSTRLFSFGFGSADTVHPKTLERDSRKRLGR